MSHDVVGRAVAAARTAGAGAGLASDTAVAIGTGSNVIVHLRPRAQPSAARSTGCRPGRARPAPPPADLAALSAERDRLTPVITQVHAAEHALHGVAFLGNLLSTPCGPRVAALLDGYGTGPDPAEPILAVSRLHGVLWSLHVAARGEASRRRAADRLDPWRGR